MLNLIFKVSEISASWKEDII